MIATWKTAAMTSTPAGILTLALAACSSSQSPADPVGQESTDAPARGDFGPPDARGDALPSADQDLGFTAGPAPCSLCAQSQCAADYAACTATSSCGAILGCIDACVSEDGGVTDAAVRACVDACGTAWDGGAEGAAIEASCLTTVCKAACGR